jgi:glycosyltransferase involved in cell wall biosynthesis
MKRLLFLVEGDPKDLSNFSGIPYFFTRALREHLAKLNIELELIETSYLLNVEELLLCLDQLRQGRLVAELMPHVQAELRQRKLEFPINNELFLQAQECKVSSAAALRIYYSRISEHMNSILSGISRAGDAILSQNHFYPYVGSNQSVYYFLDASLVDFYFNERFGAVQDRQEKRDLESVYVDMEREVLRNARRLFCFSSALKDDLRDRWLIPEEKFTVIGGGVNLELFPEPLLRSASSIFNLFFVGLDFERKGGHVLIEAMEILLGEPVNLTIVTRLKRLAGISVPDNVVVLPAGDKKYLDSLYRSADAFVFPTLFEPFGLVITEAMAYSLPVISTRVFAIPEILGTDNSSLLIEPGDAKSLAEGIRFLLKHPDIRSRIGKRNFLRAQKNFQWSIVANKLVTRSLSDSLAVETVKQ